MGNKIISCKQCKTKIYNSILKEKKSWGEFMVLVERVRLGQEGYYQQ